MILRFHPSGQNVISVHDLATNSLQHFMLSTGPLVTQVCVRANGVSIRSHLFPPLLRVTAFIQESIFEGRCPDQRLSRESEPTSSASGDAEEHLTVQDCILSAMDHVGTRNAIANKKAGTHSEAWPSGYAHMRSGIQTYNFFFAGRLRTVSVFSTTGFR